MDSQSAPTSTGSRYMLSRPQWTYTVRRYEFILATLAVLVAYALLLPPASAVASPGGWAALSLFLLLTLAWSGNILTDGGKPDLLKGAVAFGLVFLLCWLFYRYSGTRWDRLGRSFFNFGKIQGSWGLLFGGFLVTLELAAISAVCSVLIGMIVGVLRWFNNPALNVFLIAYIDVFRSVPMIVLMVVIYYALPYVGITLVSITATIAALSLGYGAYAAESFRAGIESVHFGQVEAARALGLTPLQTMRLVILPQAIRVVIPPLTGNLVAMLKDTAVASVVASPELLMRARETYIGNANPTPLVAAAGIYLIVLLPLARFANWLEHRLGAKVKPR